MTPPKQTERYTYPQLAELLKIAIDRNVVVFRHRPNSTWMIETHDPELDYIVYLNPLNNDLLTTAEWLGLWMEKDSIKYMTFQLHINTEIADEYFRTGELKSTRFVLLTEGHF
jgi:hypothetical protein